MLRPSPPHPSPYHTLHIIMHTYKSFSMSTNRGGLSPRARLCNYIHVARYKCRFKKKKKETSQNMASRRPQAQQKTPLNLSSPFSPPTLPQPHLLYLPLPRSTQAIPPYPSHTERHLVMLLIRRIPLHKSLRHPAIPGSVLGATKNLLLRGM